MDCPRESPLNIDLSPYQRRGKQLVLEANGHLSVNPSLASGAQPETGPAWKRLARPGFLGFWPGLAGKCGLVKPGKHGHGQAFVATLATKAWPSWPCYFQGRAILANLVKRAQPNPGLKDSSQAWLGFFEFPGQKFITLSDCKIKPQNLWPLVVP